jgi:putative transposase
MGRKVHSSEEIIRKLRQAEVMIHEGKTVTELCRELGVSDATYYKWRKEYGGMKMDQAKRLKDLERENGRLRRVVADLTLDKLILQDVSTGKY